MELLLGQTMPIPSHALAAIAAVVLGGAHGGLGWRWLVLGGFGWFGAVLGGFGWFWVVRNQVSENG